MVTIHCVALYVFCGLQSRSYKFNKEDIILEKMMLTFDGHHDLTIFH
jgi:hypothetical protein